MSTAYQVTVSFGLRARPLTMGYAAEADARAAARKWAANVSVSRVYVTRLQTIQALLGAGYGGGGNDDAGSPAAESSKGHEGDRQGGQGGWSGAI